MSVARLLGQNPVQNSGVTRTIRAIAVAAGAAIALPAPPALAGVVMEAERKHEAANDTRADAQFIYPEDFTPNADPDIPGDLPTVTVVGRAGGADVDFFAFEMTEPGVLMTGVLDAALSFDPFLSVFDNDGRLLAFSTPPAADRDAETDDLPFVGVLYIPEPGVYFIAISASDNAPRVLRPDLRATDETLPDLDVTRLVRPDGRPGGYAVIDPPRALDQYADSGEPGAYPYTFFISISAPAPPITPSLIDLLTSSRGDVPLFLPAGPLFDPIPGAPAPPGGGGGGDDDDDDNGGGNGGGETPVIPLPAPGLMGLVGLAALALRRQRPEAF